jgi:hypothetical protein
MNGTPGGTITVGTRLSFDGGLWEVTELAATAVVLRDALGGLRQASISGLLADPATRLLDTAPAGPAPAGPGISGLAPPEAEEMRRLAGHVQEVLTGYQPSPGGPPPASRPRQRSPRPPAGLAAVTGANCGCRPRHPAERAGRSAAGARGHQRELARPGPCPRPRMRHRYGAAPSATSPVSCGPRTKVSRARMGSPSSRASDRAAMTPGSSSKSPISTETSMLVPCAIGSQLGVPSDSPSQKSSRRRWRSLLGMAGSSTSRRA